MMVRNESSEWGPPSRLMVRSAHPMPASRSRMTTVAPASDSRRALASPIPEAPPVMIAVVFSNMAPDLTTPGMQPQLGPFALHVAETERARGMNETPCRDVLAVIQCYVDVECDLCTMLAIAAHLDH